MTFVALWRLSHYDVCRLWRLSHYDVCCSCCLSRYDVCRIMTFVALWCLSFMTFVALWCLSPIMTSVAYRVCRSINGCTLTVSLWFTAWRLRQRRALLPGKISKISCQCLFKVGIRSVFKSAKRSFWIRSKIIQIHITGF